MLISKASEISPEKLRDSLQKQSTIDIEIVEDILSDVKARGDTALKSLAEKFDDLGTRSIRVSREEIETQASAITPKLRAAIDAQIINLTAFHHGQVRAPYNVTIAEGLRAGQMSRPIARVGLYAPGGTAPLFSTLAMLLVPVTLARVPSIAICNPSPSDKPTNPAIAYLLMKFSQFELYRIGGAQAIAALAFGTETIQPVHKILGQGNQFVDFAKRIVSQHGVAIDSPAGPSELLIIADESASARTVAADILGQTEHGPDTPVVVLHTTETFASAVQVELENLLATLPRASISAQSLKLLSLLRVESIAEAITFSNEFAPEHLSFQCKDAEGHLSAVTAAGSVFLGHFAPEALGDYVSGPNHILPTSGTAAAFSGVTVSSFEKTITWQSVTEAGLRTQIAAASTLARAEGLEGHARSMEVRLRK